MTSHIPKRPCDKVSHIRKGPTPTYGHWTEYICYPVSACGSFRYVGHCTVIWLLCYVGNFFLGYRYLLYVSMCPNSLHQNKIDQNSLDTVQLRRVIHCRLQICESPGGNPSESASALSTIPFCNLATTPKPNYCISKQGAN